MKKKYLIISLLFIFLLTGCKAKYSLEIKNDVIKETLTITGNSDDERIMEKDDFDYSFYDYSRMYGEDNNIDTDYEAFYDEEGCTDSCKYYQKKYINDNGVVGFELSNEFSFEEFKSATIAKELIPSFSTVYDGRYIKISGGPHWKYFSSYKNLDELDISINTNYKVVSTNMKETSEGKYEKSLSEDDGSLYITLDTKTVLDIGETEEKNNIIIYFIIFIIISVIALLICGLKDRKKYR